jgi:hypothetical protein
MVASSEFDRPAQPQRSPAILRSKYQQLTTPDEAARWFAVDPETPQAKVIPFRPKLNRRKAE